MTTCEFINTSGTLGRGAVTKRCKREATARVWRRPMKGFKARVYDMCTFHANRSTNVEAMRPIGKEGR